MQKLRKEEEKKGKKNEERKEEWKKGRRESENIERRRENGVKQRDGV